MASTNLISDAKSVLNTPPTSPTKANAINPDGPIMDFTGNASAVVAKAQEADNALLRLLQVIDGSDGNKTDLTAVQHAMVGGSAPDDTVLTTIGSIYAAGPSDATTAKAIAAAGPILDWQGMVAAVQLTLEEMMILLTQMASITDGSDPNLTTINNMLDTLS